MVSIICITYNQEKYIRQALKSFIMQKTNFLFEVIVAEDCSQDNTAEIVKEFEFKYPNIIKPIYRSQNIGGMLNLKDALCKASGKYIALCEGDDYFTDENKLQIQVDFLEKNADYSIWFHPVRCFFDKKEQPDLIFPETRDASKFTVKELLKSNFIQTNSVVYRKQEYKELPINIIPGDWYLHLYHAIFGKIGFINRVMSDYRRHSGGIWVDAVTNLDRHYKNHGVSLVRMLCEVLKLYSKNEEYKEIILANINYLLSKYFDIGKKDNIDLLEKSVSQVPRDQLEMILCHAYKDLNEHVYLGYSKNIVLNQILNSRKWRIITKIEGLIPCWINNILKNLT